MYILKTKVVLISILLTTVCVCSNASIVIDMEPDELREFLQEQISGRAVTSITPRIQSSSVVKHVKKMVSSMIQMVGIMLTLVGANLLTHLFDNSLIINQHCVDNNVTNFLPSKAPSQQCEYDFGCDRNMCWRTCNAGSVVREESNSQSWCYTTSTHESHNYQQCLYSHDCSPCWECLGACHSQIRETKNG